MGAIVGTGICTLIGVGTERAGPAIILAFALSGVACALAALADAELAAMLPEAGTRLSAITTFNSLGPTPGDIVVTTRKSNESILDVPLSVSAVSAEQIEKRGIASINDIARFTPSININNNAVSRNDRSAQQLIIRGFTPSAFTNSIASLFIDGVPVSSSSAISIISSAERGEVLKGPQSAYFGRNTFVGAINVVNKKPMTALAGAIRATLGTRDLYRLHGELEGPLAGDWLRFRITGDRFNKGGSYKNRFNPSETLGDQRADSGTLTLFRTPSGHSSG